METKELADELMIWLPRLSDGKTLEAVYQNGDTTKILDVHDLISFIESHTEIRIKQ